MQIRVNKRSQKPIAALEPEAEKLKKERANYEDLLKLCLDWVRLRTGLSCRQLRKAAFMEEFENEPLDDERGKLAELDRRGETALLWRILWADHRDMVVSVKWPTLETSPPATEAAANEGGTNKLTAGKSVGLRPCDRKALSQYEHAMEQQPTLTTDDEAYDWLVDDAEADDAPMARRDHWKRYLRKARAFCDRQKNGPRIGNETRSVVSAKRLDTVKRTKTDHR